jgi:putative transposase
MKASRFSDAQKAFILKQGSDGMPVADLCRKVGIRLHGRGNGARPASPYIVPRFSPFDPSIAS